MATAKETRERRFPADVITFDGRARQDTPTRFHFNFDPTRYPDPKRVIDQAQGAGLQDLLLGVSVGLGQSPRVPHVPAKRLLPEAQRR